MTKMKHQLLSQSVLLASAIALTGCQSILPPVSGGSETLLIAQQGLGTLALGVRWPDASPFQTQVMPGRTQTITIQFVKLNAAGQPTAEPVLDSQGNDLPDVQITRGQGSMFRHFGLKPQENIKVIATATDANGGTLGVGERVVDVIPGHTNYVSLEIQMATALAPKLDPLANPSLVLDQPILVKGANFAKPSGYEMWGELRIDGQVPTHINGIPVSFFRVPVSVFPKDETSAEIRISAEHLDNDLDPYFRDKEGKVKLTLTLFVDDVPTNPVEVSLPKTGNLNSRVSFQEGTAATASTGVAGNYSMSVQTTFSMPMVRGTTWEYEVNEDGGLYPRTFEIIEWPSSDPNAPKPLAMRTKSRYGWMSETLLDSFYESDFPFLSLFGRGQLLRLGTEPVTLPGDSQPVQAVRYYAPTQSPYSGGRDLWFVDGVGLVKMVFRGVSRSYNGTFEHRSTTVTLKQFTTP